MPIAYNPHLEHRDLYDDFLVANRIHPNRIHNNYGFVVTLFRENIRPYLMQFARIPSVKIPQVEPLIQHAFNAENIALRFFKLLDLSGNVEVECDENGEPLTEFHPKETLDPEIPRQLEAMLRSIFSFSLMVEKLTRDGVIQKLDPNRVSTTKSLKLDLSYVAPLEKFESHFLKKIGSGDPITTLPDLLTFLGKFSKIFAPICILLSRPVMAPYLLPEHHNHIRTILENRRKVVSHFNLGSRVEPRTLLEEIDPQALIEKMVNSLYQLALVQATLPSVPLISAPQSARLPEVERPFRELTRRRSFDSATPPKNLDRGRQVNLDYVEMFQFEGAKQRLKLVKAELIYFRYDPDYPTFLRCNSIDLDALAEGNHFVQFYNTRVLPFLRELWDKSPRKELSNGLKSQEEIRSLVNEVIIRGSYINTLLGQLQPQHRPKSLPISKAQVNELLTHLHRVYVLSR